MKHITYKILWSNNDYFYVGSTTQVLEKRLQQHKKTCFGPKTKNRNDKLANVWKKYGDPFIVLTGIYETEEEMLVGEQTYIDLYFGKENCLNLNPSATKPPIGRRKGATLSQETKNKIGNANRGKKRTDEVKEKLSILNKEKGKVPPSPRGRIVSDETRAKLSENMKRIWEIRRGGVPFQK